MYTHSCGSNCIERGGSGFVIIPGGCASPDIPWRCPNAGRCAHLDGMRQRREAEVEIRRSALFHWQRKRGGRHANP